MASWSCSADVSLLGTPGGWAGSSASPKAVSRVPLSNVGRDDDAPGERQGEEEGAHGGPAASVGRSPTRVARRGLKRRRGGA